MITVEQKENSHVFSIMKGLGIIFVVVGHTSYSPVHNFVYLFHLAVFYFVAGYFFKDKYIDDKLLFLWKKIKSLWFPLIGYGIVFMLLHNLFSELIFIILRPAICTHDKTIWIVLKIFVLASLRSNCWVHCGF